MLQRSMHNTNFLLLVSSPLAKNYPRKLHVLQTGFGKNSDECAYFIYRLL